MTFGPLPSVPSLLLILRLSCPPEARSLAPPRVEKTQPPLPPSPHPSWPTQATQSPPLSVAPSQFIVPPFPSFSGAVLLGTSWIHSSFG